MKDLWRYAIRATDGEIGAVHDLLFDDVSWRIRYLVANTHRWFPGRKVLVSPVALHEPDWATREIPVTLSREQIRNAPGIEEDEPVSRQYEHELVRVFGWPAYWIEHLPAVPGAGGGPPPPTAQPPEPTTPADPHLRSGREVAGYRIQADDGELGRVEDLIVDTAGWVVQYLIIDTQPWRPGKHVVIAPGWTQHIDWSERRVRVDLTQDLIRRAPPYNPNEPINREFEERLYDFHGRPVK